MDAQPVTIALEDESAGYEAKPGRVRLGALAAFASDVEVFLRGESREIDPAQLDVAVEEGSLAIATVPLPLDLSIFRDLQRMLTGEKLDGIDKRRQEIIEKWQKLSKGVRRIAVRITSPALPRPVAITPSSDYHSDDSNHWVNVERYVRGELEDLGGSTRTNAHIRLPSGVLLKVATDRDTIRGEKSNLVYRKVRVRIKAKFNIHTGELRNAHLISFEELPTVNSEDDLTVLHRNGAQAWKDVGSASAWVDDMRGSSNGSSGER